MRILLLSLALLAVQPASARVSVDIDAALPGVSIGLSSPIHRSFERVPGLPVYYAPRANSNAFFYDGRYWRYQADNWATSHRDSGPWHRVSRLDVPSTLLLVPVRYYRAAPAYFRQWRHDAPPRWEQRWGREWSSRRVGWDQRDRARAPVALPKPDRWQPLPHFDHRQQKPRETVRRQEGRTSRQQVGRGNSRSNERRGQRPREELRQPSSPGKSSHWAARDRR